MNTLNGPDQCLKARLLLTVYREEEEGYAPTSPNLFSRFPDCLAIPMHMGKRQPRLFFRNFKSA